MLFQTLIILSLSLFIYWFSPKVNIDSNYKFPSIPDRLVQTKDAKIISYDQAEKKFINKIVGPESFTHNPETGEIYTGSHDGLIWRINKELTHADPLMRIGEDHEDCGSAHMAQHCGRILGLKFLSPDKLIVADSYNGIIIVHLDTLEKEVLVKLDQDSMTKSVKMFNSVDVSRNGMVYFTVFSMRYNVNAFIYSLIEGENTGRIYSYDLKTKELKIIFKDLYAANGLLLVDNETSLVVSEFMKMRILKVNLLNLNEQPTVFVDNLPGSPDNIKRVDDNTFYVALIDVYSNWIHRFFVSFPAVRGIISWLTPQWLLMQFFPAHSQVYKINEQGQIVAVVNGTGLGNIFITEGYQVPGKILFGNVHYPFFYALNFP